jgi:hypothetical protein
MKKATPLQLKEIRGIFVFRAGYSSVGQERLTAEFLILMKMKRLKCRTKTLTCTLCGFRAR